VYSLIYAAERSEAYHKTQQLLKGAAPAAASIDDVLAETDALVKSAKDKAAAAPAEEE
jgi:hypothetical protein